MSLLASTIIYLFFTLPGLTHFLYQSSSGIVRLIIIYHKSLPRKMRYKRLSWVWISKNNNNNKKKGVSPDKALISVFFFLYEYQQTGWSVCTGVIALCARSFNTLACNICFTLVLSGELTRSVCGVKQGGCPSKCHARVDKSSEYSVLQRPRWFRNISMISRRSGPRQVLSSSPWWLRDPSWLWSLGEYPYQFLGFRLKK